MGSRGPTPKDPDKRVRRGATPEIIEIPRDERPIDAPALPELRSNGLEWMAPTREWFETWRTSPIATLFEPQDWQRLRMLAEVVDDYFRVPSKDVLGEIRQNEKMLGGTVEDRKRLGIKIVDEVKGEPAAASARRSDPRLKVLAGGK